jgi:tRNA 5-methylaminomethyl-2-thiouridine biosynthesis bifunctional protein
MSEPLDWSGPAPRSPRFDDIYFSPADGLAEARAVFLAGCDLPQAWACRDRFTVGELGFGTGLNLLALIDLWRRSRPAPNAKLHLFSVEAFPIGRRDAERALAAWPELADIAAPLLTDWPGGRKGFHRIEWPEDGVILDLAILEAEDALSAWSGRADAWFLDGFAPSKNPAMWRPEVLGLVAARSAPGGRAATFSVAGAVRRGLQDAGFTISRAPGFGRKKERLEARLLDPAIEPEPPEIQCPTQIAIIGAGIAGAALARAFRRLGHEAQVFEGTGPGAGGSGNPSALVTPRLDAGLGPGAELYAQTFARAVQLYRAEAPNAVITEGALQLATQPRDPARFDKIAAWNGFDPGGVERRNEPSTATALCEAQAPSSLHMRDAMVIEPAPVLAAWLPLAITVVRVDRLDPDGDRWRLIDPAGTVLMRADIVCFANGPAASRLAPGVRLRPVRGQAGFTDAVAFTGAPAAFGGYAIPLWNGGVLYGATHDRDDWDEDVRAEDEDLNLRALAEGRPALAEQVRRAPRCARASLRAMSPDHLPLAGAVPGSAGLFVLSGFGGRGFTLAPLLAEAVAAEALRAPSPLPRALSALVDPGRFGEP